MHSNNEGVTEVVSEWRREIERRFEADFPFAGNARVRVNMRRVHYCLRVSTDLQVTQMWELDNHRKSRSFQNCQRPMLLGITDNISPSPSSLSPDVG